MSDINPPNSHHSAAMKVVNVVRSIFPDHDTRVVEMLVEEESSQRALDEGRRCSVGSGGGRVPVNWDEVKNRVCNRILELKSDDNNDPPDLSNNLSSPHGFGGHQRSFSAGAASHLLSPRSPGKMLQHVQSQSSMESISSARSNLPSPPPHLVQEQRRQAGVTGVTSNVPPPLPRPRLRTNSGLDKAGANNNHANVIVTSPSSPLLFTLPERSPRHSGQGHGVLNNSGSSVLFSEQTIGRAPASPHCPSDVSSGFTPPKACSETSEKTSRRIPSDPVLKEAALSIRSGVEGMRGLQKIIDIMANNLMLLRLEASTHDQRRDSIHPNEETAVVEKEISLVETKVLSYFAKLMLLKSSVQETIKKHQSNPVVFALSCLDVDSPYAATAVYATLQQFFDIFGIPASCTDLFLRNSLTIEHLLMLNESSLLELLERLDMENEFWIILNVAVNRLKEALRTRHADEAFTSPLSSPKDNVIFGQKNVRHQGVLRGGDMSPPVTTLTGGNALGGTLSRRVSLPREFASSSQSRAIITRCKYNVTTPVITSKHARGSSAPDRRVIGDFVNYLTPDENSRSVEEGIQIKDGRVKSILSESKSPPRSRFHMSQSISENNIDRLSSYDHFDYEVASSDDDDLNGTRSSNTLGLDLQVVTTGGLSQSHPDLFSSSNGRVELSSPSIMRENVHCISQTKSMPAKSSSKRLSFHLSCKIKHRFSVKKFMMPSSCDACSKILVYGVACKECKKKYHAKCSKVLDSNCDLRGYDYSNSDVGSSQPRKIYSHKRSLSTGPLNMSDAASADNLLSPERLYVLPHVERTNSMPFMQRAMSMDSNNSITSYDSDNGRYRTTSDSVVTAKNYSENRINKGTKSDLTVVAQEELPPQDSIVRNRSSMMETPSSKPRLDNVVGIQRSVSSPSGNPHGRGDNIKDYTPRRRQFGVKRREYSSISDWEIPPWELQYGEMLGEGTFGVVFRGKWHGDVAIKRLKVSNPTDEQLTAFSNEVSVLRRTRHENILLFMGACTMPDHLAIVTKFCPGSSLYQRIHVSDDDISIPWIIDTSRQIAQGMEYLHARKIIHRDLKSRNIFLDESDKVNIGDFGLATMKELSKRMDEDAVAVPQGSLHYLSPEIVRAAKDPYTVYSDVYAYGVVLYEILARALPYKDMMQEQILFAIGRGVIPDIGNCRKDLPKFSALMRKCWEKAPTCRPLFDFLLSEIDDCRPAAAASMMRSMSVPSSKVVRAEMKTKASVAMLKMMHSERSIRSPKIDYSSTIHDPSIVNDFGVTDSYFVKVSMPIDNDNNIDVEASNHHARVHSGDLHISSGAHSRGNSTSDVDPDEKANNVENMMHDTFVLPPMPAEMG